MHIHHVLVVGQVDARFSELPDPHLPDLSTLDGTVDLFSLCIFAELGEFLDPTAYRKQRRNDRELEQDRLSEIHTRGAARELLQFWTGQFSILTPGKRSFDSKNIFRQLFAHTIKVLIAYKKLAEKKKMQTEDAACTAEAFQSLVHKYFPSLDGTPPLEGSSAENFSWPIPGYTVIISPKTVKHNMKHKSSG